MAIFWFHKNDECSCNLDSLDFGYLERGQSKQEAVTIINSAGHERGNKSSAVSFLCYHKEIHYQHSFACFMHLIRKYQIEFVWISFGKAYITAKAQKLTIESSLADNLVVAPKFFIKKLHKMFKMVFWSSINYVHVNLKWVSESWPVYAKPNVAKFNSSILIQLNIYLFNSVRICSIQSLHSLNLIRIYSV